MLVTVSYWVGYTNQQHTYLSFPSNVRSKMQPPFWHPSYFEVKNNFRSRYCKTFLIHNQAMHQKMLKTFLVQDDSNSRPGVVRFKQVWCKLKCNIWCLKLKQQNLILCVDAIAQWLHLRLPYCCSRFESQAQQIMLFIYLYETEIKFTIGLQIKQSFNRNRKYPGQALNLLRPRILWQMEEQSGTSQLLYLYSPW